MPIPQLTDTVQLNDPHAGNANAGNGGDGISHGDIYFQPSAEFEATQRVTGADVDLHNGSHFSLHGDWDAGGGGPGGEAENGTLSSLTGGAGGAATSNGSLAATGGVDAASATANTTATQTSTQLADQHGTIIAGMGGNGGNNNIAVGGAISAALVHTDPSTVTHTDTHTESVSNLLSNVHDFGSIDHLGT